MLLLVDLARLDRRERHGVVVDRHPDLEQDLGVVVVDELRADDRRVRPVRLLDHHAHARRDRARRRRGRRAGRSRPRPCCSASFAAAANPTFVGEPAHVRGRAARPRSGRSDRRRTRCRARAPTAPGSPGRPATRAPPRATARAGGDDDRDDRRRRASAPGFGRIRGVAARPARRELGRIRRLEPRRRPAPARRLGSGSGTSGSERSGSGASAAAPLVDSGGSIVSMRPVDISRPGSAVVLAGVSTLDYSREHRRAPLPAGELATGESWTCARP